MTRLNFNVVEQAIKNGCTWITWIFQNWLFYNWDLQNRVVSIHMWEDMFLQYNLSELECSKINYLRCHRNGRGKSFNYLKQCQTWITKQWICESPFGLLFNPKNYSGISWVIQNYDLVRHVRLEVSKVNLQQIWKTNFVE